MLIVIVAVLCRLQSSKQSIKVLTLNLECCSEVTCEDLVLVPALDTVFSLGLLLVHTTWFV